MLNLLRDEKHSREIKLHIIYYDCIKLWNKDLREAII